MITTAPTAMAFSTINYILTMTSNNNEQEKPKTRTRRTTSSSSSSTANTPETTNNNPQSPQTHTNMNSTFKLIFSTIGSLIISILRFLLVVLYSCFKLVHTICEFFINSLDYIINRLRP